MVGRFIDVSLTEDDLETAKRIGANRSNGKDRYSSSRPFMVGDSTSREGHILGALGEIAVAKWLRMLPDEDVRPDGDGGIDLSYRGVTLDVQTTRYSPAILKYQEEHPFRADAAILVEVRAQSECMLAGWTTRKSFHEFGMPKNFGHGPRKIMETALLHSMMNLKPWMELTANRRLASRAPESPALAYKAH